MANSGFESGLAPWSAYQVGGSVTRVKTTRHGGKWAALVRLIGSQAVPYGLSDLGAVGYPPKGEKFVFSAWVRPTVPSVGHIVSLELVEREGSQASSIIASKEFELRPGWNRFEVSGKVRGAPSAIDAYVIAQISIGVDDGFFVDDVTLRDLSLLARLKRARL